MWNTKPKPRRCRCITHTHKHIVHEGSLGREKLQRLGVIDNELSFTVPRNKRVPHSS
jgi:hypothetical protein